MTDALQTLLTNTAELADFEAEYRALVDTCGVALRSDRRFVRIRGERRAEMLNGLVTNRVVDLSGHGCHALLLTAKGRVLTDMRVFPEADALLLELPETGLANLLEALRKYLPPIYATYEDVSDSLAQLGLYGPRAAAAAAETLGSDLPAEPNACRLIELDGDSAFVVRERRLPADGVELIVAAERLRDWAQRALVACEAEGGRAVGAPALEVLRVEAGLPAYGRDMDESNLAQETGLESAISHDKGCYLGQEVVARIHFRGHVNRLLRGLELGDARAVPGAVGASLADGDREVGRVTSAVASPDLGPIGLGYVRREVEPGDTLRWSGQDAEGVATVRVLPFRGDAL